MGAGVAGRRLLSHLTKASPLPDGKACDASANPLTVLIWKARHRGRV